MHHGSESQSRIGRTSRDDDPGACLQRFDQREGSQVDIAAQDLGPDLPNGFSTLQVIEGDASSDHLVEPAEDVIAGNDGDLRAADSFFTRCLDDGPGARCWVHAAGIRDDLDVSLQQSRKNPRCQGNKIAGVAEAGIAVLLLLQNGHRDLGQVVEHEIIDGSLLDLAHGSFQPVAPEALSIGDSEARISSE